MIVVTIFTTTPLAGTAEDFDHAGVRYAFRLLEAQGPRQVVDGPMFVFVDWTLPDISGLEMCRRLRAHPRTAEAHLTMVLESDDPEDRRRALRAGADDYIAAPLDRTRALDRVMSLFDANMPAAGQQAIVRGDLVIDLAAMQARWRGRAIRLAENEFRLLRFLAEHPNQVHSREELMAALGKGETPLHERTTDVWMKRLRSALKDVGNAEALRTVRLHGYALDLPAEPRPQTRRAGPRAE